MSGMRIAAAAMIVLATSMLLASPANGCAVCYGGEGSDMTTGMNNGILTLLGVVGVVQFGFIGLFASIWYRTRKLRKLREQFHLIEGEG